jgi:hypothetical protein
VGPSKAIWGILPRSHYMSMSQNSNVFNFYDACWTVDIQWRWRRLGSSWSIGMCISLFPGVRRRSASSCVALSHRNGEETATQSGHFSDGLPFKGVEIRYNRYNSENSSNSCTENEIGG